MAYVTRTEIEALLGPEALRQVLDADLDGEDDAGAFEALAEAASSRVDAVLGLAHAVPFAAPYPAAVVGAARAFCCELVYRRSARDPKNNPWLDAAKTWEGRLEAIAAGTLPLHPVTAVKGGRVGTPTTAFQPHNQEGV